MMNKAEYIMISVTLLISGLLISIVRNIIYKSGQDYSAFSVIIFLSSIINNCAILFNALCG